MADKTNRKSHHVSDMMQYACANTTCDLLRSDCSDWPQPRRTGSFHSQTFPLHVQVRL